MIPSYNLNIKKIPIYIINLAKHRNKLDKITSDLLKYNFTNINIFPALYDKIPGVGCALSHKTLLESNIDPPYLVLEDDCVICNNLESIEIPDNADALYLGISKWGYHDDTGTIKKSKHKNYVVCEQTEYHNLYRIQNMLSTHAIVYLSKEYIRQTIKIANFFIKTKDHFDKGIAENMKYHNIFSLNQPMFYQTSSPDCTNIQLSDISINKKSYE
jgi:GR25 family glycosyltransferase involved in LPS biosynthesis